MPVAPRCDRTTLVTVKPLALAKLTAQLHTGPCTVGFEEEYPAAKRKLQSGRRRHIRLATHTTQHIIHGRQTECCYRICRKVAHAVTGLCQAAHDSALTVAHLERRLVAMCPREAAAETLEDRQQYVLERCVLPDFTSPIFEPCICSSIIS